MSYMANHKCLIVVPFFDLLSWVYYSVHSSQINTPSWTAPSSVWMDAQVMCCSQKSCALTPLSHCRRRIKSSTSLMSGYALWQTPSRRKRCLIADLSVFMFRRLLLPDTFPNLAAALPARLWRWSCVDIQRRSLRSLCTVRNEQMW